MMDRFDQKLKEALAMRDEPPETLTNQIMAQIRAEKPRKNPAILWVGMSSVVAGLLIVAVVFGTGVFTKPGQEMAKQPAAEMAAFSDESDKLASKSEPGAVGGAANEKAAGSGNAQERMLESKPPANATEPGKTVSRPATPQELEEFKRPLGLTVDSITSALPKVDMTFKSANTMQSWTDAYGATKPFTSLIKTEIISKEAKLKDSKKTYKMTATINTLDYGRWVEAAKKALPGLVIDGKAPADTSAMNVVIYFEPK